MECTTLLESAEQRLLAGNLTETDFTSQIHDCLPKACNDVYGSANIDLAGTGLYYSTLIQVALFALCGPLQALISRCLPRHASTSTHLSLTRFQCVLDTAFSTGTLLALGITAAGLIRTSLYPIAALERSLIRDTSDLQSMLQNLAMATYIIMKTQPNISRGSRAWSPVGVYASCQTINVVTWYLKRRVDELPSTKLLTKLCTAQAEASTTYPHLNMSAAPSWNPLVVGGIGGISIALIGIAISFALPNFWRWLGKIFINRFVGVVVAVLWIGGCLACTSFWVYHVTYTRQGLEGTPAWDVGQVVVVAIWLPAVVQFGLAVLLTLTPGRREWDGDSNRVARIGGVILHGLYETWFGKEPFVEAEKSEEKKAEEEDDPSSRPSAPNGTMDEKAPLVTESMPQDENTTSRRASPGAQV